MLIVVIGAVAIDTIDTVKEYPKEDSEVRVEQRITKIGGNAANIVKVLNNLESESVLIYSANHSIQNDLVIDSFKDSFGKILPVYTKNDENSMFPASNIIVCENTRTILHYRNLPEINYDDFVKLKIDTNNAPAFYHFEIRNLTVFKIVKNLKNKQIVSFEFEKKRTENYKELEFVNLANYCFFSKDFVLQFLKLENSKYLNQENVKLFISQLNVDSSTTLIFPNGSNCGYMKTNNKIIQLSKPKVLSKTSNTIGAGDKFIGCFLHFIQKNNPVNACELAIKETYNQIN